jgi:hypothetical protein
MSFTLLLTTDAHGELDTRAGIFKPPASASSGFNPLMVTLAEAKVLESPCVGLRQTV